MERAYFLESPMKGTAPTIRNSEPLRSNVEKKTGRFSLPLQGAADRCGWLVYVFPGGCLEQNETFVTNGEPMAISGVVAHSMAFVPRRKRRQFLLSTNHSSSDEFRARKEGPLTSLPVRRNSRAEGLRRDCGFVWVC